MLHFCLHLYFRERKRHDLHFVCSSFKLKPRSHCQLMTSLFKKVNCVILMSLAIHVRGLRVWDGKAEINLYPGRKRRGVSKKKNSPGTRFVSVSLLKTGKMLSIYVIHVPLPFHLMGSKWLYFYFLGFAGQNAFRERCSPQNFSSFSSNSIAFDFDSFVFRFQIYIDEIISWQTYLAYGG